jgi:hypothetical protein
MQIAEFFMRAQMKQPLTFNLEMEKSPRHASPP